MAEFDLVVRRGEVVGPDGTVTTDIGVRKGKVMAVGNNLGAGAEEFDSSGLYVLPGLVDAHVHFREPGMTSKGGFADGTRAAASGGVTTVIDMPNTVPPVTDVRRLREKSRLVEPKAHVDFALYALFSGENETQFGELAAGGIAGLKLYLGKSVGGNPAPNDAAVYAGLEAARDSGLVVGVHAENDHIVDMFTERIRAVGRTDPAAHSDARPPLAEFEAVQRIVTLADAAGADLHIHHLSTGIALEQVRRCKSRGSRVTAEAIIAHLYLDKSAYREHGNLVKLNPPLRDEEDRMALWQGVGDGTVDLIATDHAPHTAYEQGRSNVWDAEGGFIGVETMLPMLLDSVSKGLLAIEDIARLCSWNPARRWGLAEKGHFMPGADADIVIVDLDSEWTIRSAELHSNAKETPFDGLRIHGAVRKTFLRGQVVAVNGSVVGQPRGRFVKPTRSARVVRKVVQHGGE